MSGSISKKNIVTSLVLLGFCVYISKLYFQGDITLYIHPRYSIFSIVMCLIAIFALIAGLVYELGKRRGTIKKRFSIGPIDCIVGIMLVLAFVLPAQTLSSKAISNKTVTTPTYDASVTGADAPSGTCPDALPQTTEEWVYQISQYPMKCYEGKPIELSGFVFLSPDKPLPDEMFYLGRLAMSCCVIDARPFALPVKATTSEPYATDTWLQVNGKLEIVEINGSPQLVIAPSKVKKIDAPSNPYEFITTSSAGSVQQTQPKLAP